MLVRRPMSAGFASGLCVKAPPKGPAEFGLCMERLGTLPVFRCGVTLDALVGYKSP